MHFICWKTVTIENRGIQQRKEPIRERGEREGEETERGREREGEREMGRAAGEENIDADVTCKKNDRIKNTTNIYQEQNQEN